MPGMKNGLTPHRMRLNKELRQKEMNLSEIYERGKTRFIQLFWINYTFLDMRLSVGDSGL